MLRLKDVGRDMGEGFSLEGVSLELPPGEFLAIIGPNGAGKSTLLKLISGELSLGSGRISIAGRERSQWGRRELARRLAVMAQTPTLRFDFSVEELVTLGRAPHNGATRAQQDRVIVSRAIELAGLRAFEDRLVPSLSGGERQRAFFSKALAQLMTCDAEADDAACLPGAGTLLLMDEPTSALDLAQQSRLMNTIKRITGEGGTVVAILHDLNLAVAFADLLAVMVGGRLRGFGTPDDLLSEAALQEWYGCAVEISRSESSRRPVISLRLS